MSTFHSHFSILILFDVLNGIISMKSNLGKGKGSIGDGSGYNVTIAHGANGERDWFYQEHLNIFRIVETYARYMVTISERSACHLVFYNMFMYMFIYRYLLFSLNVGPWASEACIVYRTWYKLQVIPRAYTVHVWSRVSMPYPSGVAKIRAPGPSPQYPRAWATRPYLPAIGVRRRSAFQNNH